MARLQRDPPPYQPWPVRVTTKRGELSRMRIASPINGDEFLFVDETAVVPVSATVPAGTRWFLNGRVLETSPEHLALLAGWHELRAVAPQGQSACTRFRVSKVNP